MKTRDKASMIKTAWYYAWLDTQANGTKEKIQKYENLVYNNALSQISKEKMGFKEKLVLVH